MKLTMKKDKSWRSAFIALNLMVFSPSGSALAAECPCEKGETCTCEECGCEACECKGNGANGKCVKGPKTDKLR